MCIGLALAISTSAWAQKQRGSFGFGKIKSAYRTARTDAIHSWRNSGAPKSAYSSHYLSHKVDGLRSLANTTQNASHKKRLTRIADRYEARLATQLMGASTPKPAVKVRSTKPTFLGTLSSMYKTGMGTLTEAMRLQNNYLNGRRDDTRALVTESMRASTTLTTRVLDGAEQMITPGWQK
jgi:flagellar hook-basal body complex protein FliE